jgi:hypothetical protein
VKNPNYSIEVLKLLNAAKVLRIATFIHTSGLYTKIEAMEATGWLCFGVTYKTENKKLCCQ